MFALLVIATMVLALPSVAAAATTTTTTPQPPPVAPAPIKLTSAQNKLLWATVNVCDTEAHPNTIGVAASMPTIRGANKLYMRFRLQYRDAATNTFKAVPGPNADSGWSLVDSRKGKSRRAGYDFMMFASATNAYVVRAVVAFQWRRNKELLLSARRLTTIGHTETKAADPKGFSAAVCTIQ